MSSAIKADFGPIPPVSREDRAAASRHVLRKAKNRDDAHQLLDMLGLNTTEENQ